MHVIRFASGGGVYLGIPQGDGTAERLEGNLFAADPAAYTAAHTLRATGQTLRVERLLAPLVPTDILCIGLNYRAHAAETGAEPPENPMLFIKASNTLNDPGGVIPLPANSAEVDYEAELCVVIGKTAKDVPAERALDYVLGYCCANDVSARDWQKQKRLGGGQFARGKSFDGFCPLGPHLVTRDEVPEPNNLIIRCELNGKVMQQSSTADMIFDVPSLIASLSSTMTLRPGTVILTGTPEGVGMARKPPVWLSDGDEVAVEIEGLGRLVNLVQKA
ncbi:MAG: fumarylacetoacetate hydrolase family protein [Phycisphaerae bacterium]